MYNTIQRQFNDLDLKISSCICIPQVNSVGQGFQKEEHYRQTDVSECITALHSHVVTTVSNKFIEAPLVGKISQW